MARRYLSLLVTGGLVLVTLTSCSQRDSPDTPSMAGQSGIRTLQKGDEYVAIGDSYTSSPGTGKSADDCLQTTKNYPHRVAARLGLKLKDVSCAGAKTTHVSTSQVTRSTQRPPQADALSRGTDLVTISLGGNDFNTFGAVAYGCTALRSGNPNGAPCQDADTAAKGRIVKRNMAVTEQRLVEVIGLVGERAPAARVIVVGYPELFPESGPCAQLPLAQGDYPFAHRINELLVRAQRRAAARTKVEYVDVFTASLGHNMCAQDPWIAGLYPTRRDDIPLHPFADEQRLVASLLIDLLI